MFHQAVTMDSAVAVMVAAIVAVVVVVVTVLHVEADKAGAQYLKFQELHHHHSDLSLLQSPITS
jgi:hypothetical protein